MKEAHLRIKSKKIKKIYIVDNSKQNLISPYTITSPQIAWQLFRIKKNFIVLGEFIAL